MQQKKFYFFLILIYIFLLYFALIIIDISIARIPKFNNKYFDAQKKLKKNTSVIDFFYPNSFFENKDNKKLSLKQNIILPGSLFYKKSNLCDEGNGPVKIETDRFGFRNDDNFWDNINTIDILLIGDSFAQGICVDKKKSISGLLNSNKYKTLNLSTGGNGSANYFFLTKLFAQEFKPRYLIILFYANDNHISDIYSPYYTLAKKLKKNDYFFRDGKSLLPSEKLKNFEKKISKTTFQSFDFNSKLVKYLRLTNLRTFYHNLFNKYELLENTKAAIDLAINECKVIKCKTVFGLIKNSSYWDPQFYYDTYKTNLRNYINSKDSTFLTFDEYLENSDNLNYSKRGGHLSELGYDKITKKIIANLK